MSREMEICLALQADIDQCLTNSSSLDGISGSEVLTALGSAPEWPKNIEYFYLGKGGLYTQVFLTFRKMGYPNFFYFIGSELSRNLAEK